MKECNCGGDDKYVKMARKIGGVLYVIVFVVAIMVVLFSVG